MIGGFIGLETQETAYPPIRGGEGLWVNSGRSALELILRAKEPRGRVFVPYYTCHTVIDTCRKLGVDLVFYRIGPDFQINDPSFEMNAEDLLVYTNYFGIMENYIDELARQWGTQLIVDNCLALFSPRRAGISAFYSFRKFVGVADGGIVEETPGAELPTIRDTSDSTADFLYQVESEQRIMEMCERNEDRISQSAPSRLSLLTERMIQGIDFQTVAHRRRSNFFYLHNALADLNKFSWEASSVSVPCFYPFWTNLTEMRNELIDRGIFLPLFWSNVLDEAPYDGEERKLARFLLPLPIDQRWDESAMDIIIDSIRKSYC